MPESRPSFRPAGWRDRLAGLAGFARRRFAGDYAVDEFGFDAELNSAVLMPAALALYRNWFRVQLRGVGNVPATGRAMIVANHSGVLPLDAIATAIEKRVAKLCRLVPVATR